MIIRNSSASAQYTFSKLLSSNPAECPALRTTNELPSKCMRLSPRLYKYGPHCIHHHCNVYSSVIVTDTTYRTNRCDVCPSEAVQCMNAVVSVAEPFPGLVRIMHLEFERVNLHKHTGIPQWPINT